MTLLRYAAAVCLLLLAAAAFLLAAFAVVECLAALINGPSLLRNAGVALSLTQLGIVFVGGCAVVALCGAGMRMLGIASIRPLLRWLNPNRPA